MIITNQDYLNTINLLKSVAKIHAIVFKFYVYEDSHYIEFHIDKEYESTVKEFVYYNMPVINEYKYIVY